jgi:regulator of protease activity HflC (stomatin/prohibitin superfamily)
MTAARPTILAETLTWSFRLLFALVAALAGMWLVRGIQRVPPENRAVVMRFGQVVRTAGPGLLLTWPSPIDSVVLLPSQGRQVQFAPEALESRSTLDERIAGTPGQGFIASDNARENTWFFLTGDGAVVHLRAMLFYQIDDPVAYITAGDHIEPMLRRALIAAAVQLCARRSLDGILVARPEAAGAAHLVAQRERFASELVQAVNQRLSQASGQSSSIGIQVARIDVVPSIPGGAKESFDTVLTVEQQAERSLADARTTAETRRQIAEQGRQTLIDEAHARSEELVRTAQARSALVLSLGRDPSLDRRTIVEQTYRDRIKSLFDIAGKIETVPVTSQAHTFIFGSSP